MEEDCWDCEIWKASPEVTDAFEELLRMSSDVSEEAMSLLERFVVLMYDRTSNIMEKNDATKKLYIQKSRALGNILPTQLAVWQHIKRALVLVIVPYTKYSNAAATAYAFLWMGSKSTTSFILIVRYFIFFSNHDLVPFSYLHTDARPTRRFYPASNPQPPGLMTTTLTTRQCEKTCLHANCWNQMLFLNPDIQTPSDCGWTKEASVWQPLWTTLQVASISHHVLIPYSHKMGCTSS